MIKIKIFEVPYFENVYISRNGDIVGIDDIDKELKMKMMMYTFYGRVDIPYGKKYKDDGIYVENLEYKISDSEVLYGDNCIYIRNIEFRRFRDSTLYVNENGVVYSSFVKRICRHRIDRDGYHRLQFGKLSNYALHRAVYETWSGITLTSDIIVHHINNKKWDNSYDNLEMTTNLLNSRYATIDGLYNSSYNFNEDDIHKMCSMLEKFHSYEEIGNEFGIKPKTKLYKNFRGLLHKLKTQSDCWVNISTQYNFDMYDDNVRHRNHKFNNKDIEEMLTDYYIRGNEIGELSDKYNTTRKAILSILNGRKRKDSYKKFFEKHKNLISSTTRES